MSGSRTIADWIDWGSAQLADKAVFFGHGTDNPADESMSLVLYALGLDYSIVESDLDREVNPLEAEKISQLIRQRCESRLPAPYITNRIWFAGYEMYVDERVLVPRSPIAELIVDGFSPWFDYHAIADKRPVKILDLCTGSGCIAIACALWLPGSKVIATDISTDALAVAAINVEKYKLQDQVTLLKSDVLTDVPEQQFDLIVSNPPYVSDEEMQTLPAEYRCEPDIGLRTGDNGLEIVSRILSDAASYLTNEGVLITEVGNSETALQEKYPQLPFTWLEFQSGGHGVFVLSRQQLPDRI